MSENVFFADSHSVNVFYLRNGELFCFETTPVLSPKKHSQFGSKKKEILKVCSGHSHTFLITTNLIAYACGTNSNGQLGIGTKANKKKFTKVPLKNINDIFCGYNHSIFFANGKVYACGYNEHGGCGVGSSTKSVLSPKKVKTSFRPLNAVGGLYFTIFLCRNGKLHKTGKIFSDNNSASPTSMGFTKIVIAHSCGIYNYLCLTKSGKLYTIMKYYDNKYTFKEIFKNMSVQKISCGLNHSLVLCENNELYSFGYGEYGQLGIGITVGKGKNKPKSIKIPGASIENIYASGNQSHVIDHLGYVWSTGCNGNGQLGNNTNEHQYIFKKNNHIPSFKGTGQYKSKDLLDVGAKLVGGKSGRQERKVVNYNNSDIMSKIRERGFYLGGARVLGGGKGGVSEVEKKDSSRSNYHRHSLRVKKSPVMVDVDAEKRKRRKSLGEKRSDEEEEEEEEEEDEEEEEEEEEEEDWKGKYERMKEKKVKYKKSGQKYKKLYVECVKDMERMEEEKKRIEKKCKKKVLQKEKTIEELKKMINNEEDLEKEMEKYEIKSEEVIKIKEIGTGGFGKCFAGQWEGSGAGVDVVIKEIALNRKVSKIKVFAEIKFHLNIRSPVVCRVFGFSFPKPDVMFIVMEKMDLDVGKYISGHNSNMSFREKMLIMQKMCQCVHVLHANEIIHRDLKCANFLTTSTGSCVKITDFGISTVLDHSKTHLTSCGKGTAPFMSPELCDTEVVKYSYASDIYALGCSFYEVTFCETPYDFPISVIFAKKRNKKPPRRLKKPPSNVPKRIIKLIKWCLNDDPIDRPTTTDLMSWFKRKLEKK